MQRRGAAPKRGRATGEVLPRRVEAVFDSVGTATWEHSLASVRRGGTVVTMGITTGRMVQLDLLPVIVDQLVIKGSIMGTRAEMLDLMNFVVRHGITPQIAQVLPMERAREGFAAMCAGRLGGKIILTR